MSAASQRGLWLAGLLTAGLSACTAPSSAPAPQLAQTSQAPKSIVDVYRIGQQGQGQNIQLQAQFHGWSACPSSMQITRSDWAIRQGEACIYVSGGLPQGIAAPPSTASNGMPVFIQAQVVWDAASNKPRLQLAR